VDASGIASGIVSGGVPVGKPRESFDPGNRIALAYP
jgi:hypothetical protein